MHRRLFSTAFIRKLADWQAC